MKKQIEKLFLQYADRETVDIQDVVNDMQKIIYAYALQMACKRLVKVLLFLPFIVADGFYFILHEVPKYIVFGRFDYNRKMLIDRLLNW